MTAHDVFVPWRPPCSVCADVSHSVEGSNSLHIAAEKGHFDLAKTLIEYATKPPSKTQTPMWTESFVKTCTELKMCT